MSTIDQQFIEYIVKSLVSNPDDVQIDRTIDEKGVLIELTVNPEDLGRVIGKRGSSAQALRTLLRALGTKNDARYNLKIVDNGEPREQREPREPRSENEQVEATDEAVVKERVQEDEAPAERTDSIADKTRKELADLDDLDI